MRTWREFLYWVCGAEDEIDRLNLGIGALQARIYSLRCSRHTYAAAPIRSFYCVECGRPMAVRVLNDWESDLRGEGKVN